MTARVMVAAMLLAAFAGAGWCAATAPRSRCAWHPRHRDTLTESISGAWHCEKEAGPCR